MEGDKKVSKQYRLLQYATGRSDNDKGYNFHRTSDSGVRITEWMRGKTRASTIADEMPTLEIKPNIGDNGVGDFVLVESRSRPLSTENRRIFTS